MRAEQISIFLENKAGRLAEVTSILAEADVNIRALAIADTSDFGVLRLIVNDNQKAVEALKNRGSKIDEQGCEILYSEPTWGIEKIPYVDPNGMSKYAYVRIQRDGIDGFVEDSIISVKEIPREHLPEFFKEAQKDQDVLNKEIRKQRESNKEDSLYWYPKLRKRADDINKNLMKEYDM